MPQEPKGAVEIVFSPEGIVMLPFAVIIDLIGIILLIFALDDFWITDIIAFTFIGTWSYFRSQVAPPPKAQVQMPSPSYDYFKQKKRFKEKIGKFKHAEGFAAQKAQSAAAAGDAKRAQKFSKAARTARNLKFLELIPYVGSLPLWSISVYMTIKYS